MTLRHVERPAAADPVGALVFFHGYYGVPEDFLPFLDKLDPDRRFHGYLPEGPIHVGEGRTSWFDFDAGGPPENQLRPVAAWLDSLPIAPERTVLGGWSQGTALAYVLALAPDRPRPAALLALGGWLPDRFPPDLVRPLPPIAIAHGTADDAVRVDEARRARDLLESAGANVSYHETPVAHEIGEHVVPHLREFLATLP